MNATWYGRQGPTHEILAVVTMPIPAPGPGDVRIRVVASGVNPRDVKKWQNSLGYGIPYLRVVPHSEGAGVIDSVGDGVPASRVGKRVWCYGARSYWPFGTAAENVVLPSTLAVPLSAGVSFEQEACPGITADRFVHSAGPVASRVVMVYGGAAPVGLCSVQLARKAGASVIATVRSSNDELVASRAGAHSVVRTDSISVANVVPVSARFPRGGGPYRGGRV